MSVPIAVLGTNRNFKFGPIVRKSLQIVRADGRQGNKLTGRELRPVTRLTPSLPESARLTNTCDNVAIVILYGNNGVSVGFLLILIIKQL